MIILAVLYSLQCFTVFKKTDSKKKNISNSKELLKESERKKIKKRNDHYSIHFANERHYSREELNAMITEPDDIDI